MKYVISDEGGPLIFQYVASIILRTTNRRLSNALVDNQRNTGHGYNYTIEEARAALKEYVTKHNKRRK